MSEQYEIIPGYGLSMLKFGLTMSETIEILGKSYIETEYIEFDRSKTITFHYSKKSLSLYFEEMDNFSLICIEIDNPEMIFMNKKFFGVKR